ncbi:tyrosine-type recombinase/integrase [Aquabacterium sp. J223]|uniref:tyrosine-type recombinase/integrase n=1 Tax=Aquabacterium sp. J223 TaxID=2898431 RepID=UPI0021ADA3A7|nr:tyrosine-type recombinase/integrase [Aquabacterium sp. J223]UUX97461.1 tyrosine-type recombinase/integrase [Aquabacterium sp. J223]
MPYRNDSLSPDEIVARIARANVTGLTLVHRRDGKAYSYDGLCAMLKRRQADVRREHTAAGGPLAAMAPWGFYDMKGKGAIDMWQSGVPLEEIQVLCGHESVRTTEIYVKSRWRGAVAPNWVASAV